MRILKYIYLGKAASGLGLRHTITQRKVADRNAPRWIQALKRYGYWPQPEAPLLPSRSDHGKSPLKTSRSPGAVGLSSVGRAFTVTFLTAVLDNQTID